MKIIAVNIPAGAQLDRDSAPSVTLYPDSALLTANRPLFLPDFMTGAAVYAAPALRISRLGKNIAPRFASRYYDSVTVATLTDIPSLGDPLRLRPESAGRPGGDLANAIEGAVAVGEWLQPAETLEISAVSAIDGGSVMMTAGLDRFNDTAAKAIALLSRYMTLKMGDIVIPCRLPEPLALNIGADISFTLNGAQTLILKPR